MSQDKTCPKQCPRCGAGIDPDWSEAFDYICYECGSDSELDGTGFQPSATCSRRAEASLRAQLTALTQQVADVERERDELQGHYDRDRVKWRQEIERLNAVHAGTFWRWQGDGNDYLESLTCPIIIDVGQLHGILSVNMEAMSKLQAAESRAKAIEEAARAALAHATELRDAWDRGAISERDGKGGLRSNRNVDVQRALCAALLTPAQKGGADGQDS